jgi:hypothetical protein
MENVNYISDRCMDLRGYGGLYQRYNKTSGDNQFPIFKARIASTIVPLLFLACNYCSMRQFVPPRPDHRALIPQTRHRIRGFLLYVIPVAPQVVTADLR